MSAPFDVFPARSGVIVSTSRVPSTWYVFLTQMGVIGDTAAPSTVRTCVPRPGRG